MVGFLITASTWRGRVTSALKLLAALATTVLVGCGGDSRGGMSRELPDSGRGGGGGSNAPVGGSGGGTTLYVTLTYPNDGLSLYQQVRVQPQLGGFEGHAANCSLVVGEKLPTGL